MPFVYAFLMTAFISRKLRPHFQTVRPYNFEVFCLRILIHSYQVAFTEAVMEVNELLGAAGSFQMRQEESSP